MEDVTALDAGREFDPRLQRGAGARCWNKDTRDRRRDPELALPETVRVAAQREALGGEGTRVVRQADDHGPIDDGWHRRRRGIQARVHSGEKEFASSSWVQVGRGHVPEVRAVPGLYPDPLTRRRNGSQGRIAREATGRFPSVGQVNGNHVVAESGTAGTYPRARSDAEHGGVGTSVAVVVLVVDVVGGAGAGIQETAPVANRW